MCGACGKTIVADQVLGAERTMRQHLIVAHAVNALCNGRSGAPRISALPDGWLVSGPSGEKLLCRTVEGLWDFIIGRFSNGSLTRLSARGPTGLR